MDAPRPMLTEPTIAVHTSFLAGIAEFQAEGRGEAEDDTLLGQHIRRFGGQWDQAEGFARYVAALRAEVLPETPRPEGIVPSSELWWTQDSTFLGRVSIRHGLTARLRERGGHIGYDVVPSARRQGHATAILRASLEVAAGLGITSALVTCNPANEASRKVIERNGGVWDSGDERILRYWVSTTSGRMP